MRPYEEGSEYDPEPMPRPTIADYSKILVGGGEDVLQCPRCKEQTLVEAVQTHRQREAFCSVCSFTWVFDVEVCTCTCVPIAHHHEDVDLLPRCPQCGKSAQTSTPCAS